MLGEPHNPRDGGAGDWSAHQDGVGEKKERHSQATVTGALSGGVL